MRLRCSCCGGEAFGKQWFNRDTGYGICIKCADMIEAKEGPEELKKGYGVRGIHFKQGKTTDVLQYK